MLLSRAQRPLETASLVVRDEESTDSLLPRLPD